MHIQLGPCVCVCARVRVCSVRRGTRTQDGGRGRARSWHRLCVRADGVHDTVWVRQRLHDAGLAPSSTCRIRNAAPDTLHHHVRWPPSLGSAPAGVGHPEGCSSGSCGRAHAARVTWMAPAHGGPHADAVILIEPVLCLLRGVLGSPRVGAGRGFCFRPRAREGREMLHGRAKGEAVGT